MKLSWVKSADFRRFHWRHGFTADSPRL